jgi:hypothetical protein
MHRRHVVLAERLGWFLALLVALYFLGAGLGHTFQIEPTTEALQEEALGFRMIRLCSIGLCCLAAYAWWRGAPVWVWLAVLVAPLICGGLSEAQPDTLLPHLCYLVAAPLAGLAGLVAVFLPWRPRSALSAGAPTVA